MLLFNLAMKERHRETARGKQRDACYRREEFKCFHDGEKNPSEKTG